jgi:hypothetical protein
MDSLVLVDGGISSNMPGVRRPGNWARIRILVVDSTSPLRTA